MVTNTLTEPFDCIMPKGPLGESYDPGGDALFASDINSGDWVALKVFANFENDFPFRTFVPADNCPVTANPSQADIDADGAGDDCDDSDNDGVFDDKDAFPNNPNESVDTDGDGTGNDADPDDDNDNVPDLQDAFPLDANESADTDGDGIGNNADTDDDNDGMTDKCESDNNFDPLDPVDGNQDVDSDGFTNVRECRAGSDPRDPTSIPNVSMPWLPVLLED